MAFEHLRSSLTKGNLWLYVLSELQVGDATPGELKLKVERRGFSPAAITFYSVIYKLKREGLVRKASESFRSPYSITPKGNAELSRAIKYIDEVGRSLLQG
ncbi:MAG: PadR family transcriptional regulator [Thaumarchaeota archaeon]|nr:PadR family transcriptional regulator [Nitrososphaerota archaeon]